MTATWYETDDDDQGPPFAGKALLMVAAASVVWGAGCVALACAVADRLWRRNRR